MQKKESHCNNKPDFPRRLFWDFRYDEIEWNDEYLTVIERVFERGSKKEWEEVIRYYGRNKVLNALKNRIKVLADYAIQNVCSYFPIKKEEMLCYIRKQSRPGRWI